MAESVGALRVDISANSAQIESDMRRVGAIVNSASAQMARGLSGFAAGATGAFRQIVSLRTAVEGLAAGAFVAGIKKATDFGDNIAKTAQKIGISTDSLQELRYAANLSGASSEDLDRVLLQLSQRLGGAQDVVDEVSKALGRLGLSIDQIKGLAPDQAFKVIADRISAVRDPFTRAQIAVQLFGRTGQQMLPVLSQGSDGFAKIAFEAHNLGIILSQETLQAAEKSNDEFTRIGNALRVAGVQLAAQFLPVIEQFSRTLTSPDFQNGLKTLASETKSWIDYMIQHKAEVLAVIGALAGFRIGGAFGAPGAAAGAILGGLGGYLKGAASDADTVKGKIAAIDAQLKELAYNEALVRNADIFYLGSSDQATKLLEIEYKRNDLIKQRQQLEQFAGDKALASAQDVANYIQASMTKAGYSVQQIAGALATVKAESSFNASNVGDNGTSFGLFQFHADRLDALKKYAADIGASFTDARVQVAFFFKDLDNQVDQSGQKLSDALKNASTPEQVAAVFAQFDRFKGYNDTASDEYQRRLALIKQYWQQIAESGRISASTVTQLTVNKQAPVFDPQVAEAMKNIAFQTRIAQGAFLDLADGFPQLVNGFELSKGAIQNFDGVVSHLPPQLQQLNAAMKQLNAAKDLQNAANSIAGAFEGAFENALFHAQNIRQVLASLAEDIAKIFLRLALLKPLENSFQSLLGGLGGGSGGFSLSGLFGGIGKLFGFAQGGSFMVGGAGGIDSQLVAFRASPDERVDVYKPGQQRDMQVQSAPVNVDNRTRIVNAFDSVDFLSQALGSAQGERVLLNFVRSNASAFRSAVA